MDLCTKSPDHPSEAATLSIVRILLQHGADLNLVDNRGRSPLHTAAVHNKPKTAEVIIANGGDVDIKDNTGPTALHQAVSIGNAELAEVLLKNNADPTIKDLNSENPMDVAAFEMFELVKESVKMDNKRYEHLYDDP